MIPIHHLSPYNRFRLAGAWHLENYISKERNQYGTMSYSIIQFKNNIRSEVEKWSGWAAGGLSRAGIPINFIIRALGSKELNPCHTKALDTMGSTIADSLNCSYEPDILYKVRETPAMHTLKTKPERKAALQGAYKANKLFPLDNSNILIIDDVTTGGVTLEEILRCMRVEWPNAGYYFFALARTQYNNNIFEVVL